MQKQPPSAPDKTPPDNLVARIKQLAKSHRKLLIWLAIAATGALVMPFWGSTALVAVGVLCLLCLYLIAGVYGLICYALSQILALPATLLVSLPLCIWALLATTRLVIASARRPARPLPVNCTEAGLFVGSGKWIKVRWQEVARLAAEPPEPDSPEAEVMVAHLTDGARIRLALPALPDDASRATLFQSICKWSPSTVIDAQLRQPWQLEQRSSYTDIWFQALDKLPDRKRLGPLQPEEALLSGLYIVKSRLSSGGQGTAYLAQSQASNSSVVLKEFVLPIVADRLERQRVLHNFETEVQVLRRLDHLQVVKLLDHFVEDFRAYLVLEHIPGSSLRELVRQQGAQPESMVWKLAVQMAGILNYLHNQSPQVVHRDFTPDNLMLSVDGQQLKLIDFNVVQVGPPTTTAQVVGKQSYLPPEQFRGEPEPASDIYAFGCTLFFLLAGHDPEPLEQSHPLLLDRQVSSEMDDLVRRLTDQDPSSRPTLEEISQAIAPHLASL